MFYQFFLDFKKKKKKKTCLLLHGRPPIFVCSICSEAHGCVSVLTCWAEMRSCRSLSPHTGLFPAA